MSIKFVLAISIFCCVFLVAINAQNQQYDDKKFRDLKALHRYDRMPPLPSLMPQNPQQDSQGNLQPSGGNKKIPVVGSHATRRPQNPQQDDQHNRFQNGGNMQVPVVGSSSTRRPLSTQPDDTPRYPYQNSPVQDSSPDLYEDDGMEQSPVVGSQRPRNPQQDTPRNRYQNNLPQNRLETLYFYPNFVRNFQRQEYNKNQNCVSTPTGVSCQQQENFRSSNYQMNSLATNISDRFRPSRF